MQQKEELSHSLAPTSYVGELTSFCNMFAERSKEENGAPYVRVWLAILENIVSDEEKSRQEAVQMLDKVLGDRQTQISEQSNADLCAVRDYLCNKQP